MYRLNMATNLGIDERLLREAQKLGKLKTKRETVNEALAEFVQRRKQLGILELFGTIDYDETYDYKAQRRRDSGVRRNRGSK
jgi:Arc/MetJ family transcription regulator